MDRNGLKCLLFVLLVFAAVYMTMVMVYRLGTAAIMIMAAVMLALGVALLFGSMTVPETRKGNYCGILSGLFLWAVLGEVCEKSGTVEMAEWQIFPLLGWFTFLVLLLAAKKYLPVGLLFLLGHFNAIWLLHFIMMNQIVFFGAVHWISYLVCGVFALLAVFSGWRMARTKSDAVNMACALSLLLTGWTVLEYLWAWRLLPGPWMLANYA